MRAVLDTCVLVSAFLTPAGYPGQILRLWNADLFELVVSPPMIEELSNVLRRPRIKGKYGYSAQDVKAFLQAIDQNAAEVNIAKATIDLCRDPDDNIVLETSIIAEAKYLVSRDDDVKRDKSVIDTMGEFSVNVVTVAQFLSVLQRELQEYS